MRIQSYPRGQTEVVSWEAVPERFDRGMTMDWQAQLIIRYLAICTHWQEVGWMQAQRHAP